MEKWSGKKGETASLGQKKVKKKNGKAKKAAKSGKSRKDGAVQDTEDVQPTVEEAPNPAEEEEDIQKVAPLSHSADEL